MNLEQFKILTDEGIDPEVIDHLRTLGWDVLDAVHAGLLGRTDLDVLRTATADSRVVMTHDGDFGQLAIAGGEPIVGILRLRPGHIRSVFTIATIDAVIAAVIDLEAPFIIVARRNSAHEVTIRVRQL